MNLEITPTDFIRTNDLKKHYITIHRVPQYLRRFKEYSWYNSSRMRFYDTTKNRFNVLLAMTTWSNLWHYHKLLHDQTHACKMTDSVQVSLSRFSPIWVPPANTTLDFWDLRIGKRITASVLRPTEVVVSRIWMKSVTPHSTLEKDVFAKYMRMTSLVCTT